MSERAGISFRDKWTARCMVKDDPVYGEISLSAAHVNGQYAYVETAVDQMRIIYTLKVIDDEQMIDTFMQAMFARATVNEWAWVFDWT